jgi:hypothetical protein
MQVAAPGTVADLVDQLRAAAAVLTYDPDTHTLRSGDTGMIVVTTGQGH